MGNFCKIRGGDGFRQPVGGYPTIGPCDGSVIEGEVVEPISGATLAKINDYEDNGVDYHRVTVWVDTETAKVEAFVSVGAK